ncbi:hypothetical protein SAMN02745127_02928 [Oceanospirillum multiglobuliferum]|uniref:General secretion pathway protein N n=1 Tax=Oceanospirillum multiglobuliferum TaxID=64969 RepID=A0A1T4SC45_9GAMM|nr:hypothetical protein [Oceanospirillum multiglobuliferum]OPX55040.1 hypothetical protein BTE48_11220 [Oceanospirillum multiglobuliferum]SKA25789.1 hypothetical protein SAMN02745127_02928 [Oceanospirillum multiglobuliferum]
MHTNPLLRKRYFYLFVATLCFGLLLQVPARYLADQLGILRFLPAHIKIEQLQGTLWQGQGILRYEHSSRPNTGDATTLELKLGWQFGLLPWLSESAPLVVTLNHIGSAIEAKLNLSGIDRFGLMLSGHIHPLLLNPFLKDNQSWISGRGQIHHLSLALKGVSLFDLPKALDDLSRHRLNLSQWPDAEINLQGAITWEGGDTYFLAGQNPIKIIYPPLALRFSQENKSLNARLTPQDNDLSLAMISLAQTGWLNVQVDGQLKRIVPTLPMNYVAQGQSLFKYKEKVF